MVSRLPVGPPSVVTAALGFPLRNETNPDRETHRDALNHYVFGLTVRMHASTHDFCNLYK